MPILGLFGTQDWTDGQRPQNWREAILYQYPNGDVPLTALLALINSERTDDYQFNWFTKLLPDQRASVTGVYTDAALSVAYVSGGVIGDILYIKMSAADVAKFRTRHQILLRDSTDYKVEVNAKVSAVTSAGASSYLTVVLREDDDNSTNDLSDADTALIIGNINSQGDTIPNALAYTPVKYYNKTQIFRTPLNITRTAMQTRLRTGSQYKEAKREALELHAIEMEKNLLWSVASEVTGANNQPETTTMGLVNAIKTYAPENVDDYSTNSDFTGTTWLDGGETWLDERLEQIFRVGSEEKLAFVGSGAVLGINKLIKNKGHFEFNPKTISYGIKVMEWVTPYGVIYLKRHPLFSYEVTNRNSMVIFEPKMLRRRFIQDTKFFKDSKDTTINYDGVKEEFLTEMGLEYHFPSAFGDLEGVGKDNA